MIIEITTAIVFSRKSSMPVRDFHKVQQKKGIFHLIKVLTAIRFLKKQVKHGPTKKTIDYVFDTGDTMTDNEGKLYEQRIIVFINRLKCLLYEDEEALSASYCRFNPMISFENRRNSEYKQIKKGARWGKNWERAWFHITGRVPKEWQGKHVRARINLGAEGLVFSEDGMPVGGLSFHSLWEEIDFQRDHIEVTRAAKGGEAVEFWIEATAAQLFGLKLDNEMGNRVPKEYGHYEAAIQYIELCVFREDIWHLYLDCHVLNNQMTKLPEKSVRRARLLRTLNQVIDKFNVNAAGVKRARNLLKAELQKPAAASSLKTQAIGHAHIDTAWLWPVEETIRKCARTFSSQIELIEKYSNYVFGASAAQHYAIIKEFYPTLYAKIKQKVAERRWELQGGMWIEPDCNLVSGESLVRQILHGKNFFKSEFGIDINNLWLPDVFGYSAALPQILQKCGIDHFVTQKISWNQFNRFPHHTFIWQGIDGSEVIAHFPPEDTYNSDLRPAALIHAQENFTEKAYLEEFLTLFGVGDGGGGPTEEFIEMGIRQQNLEGSPRVNFGTAAAMFDRLKEKKNLLPKWVGELYLELHRGTLTSQAYNKKMNRHMELKLREIEMLYALLPLTDYPSGQLDAIWKKVLLNQFHDIIPGSSITPVYEQSKQEYDDLLRKAERLIARAGDVLFENDEDRLTILNTLSYHYQGAVKLPNSWHSCGVYDEQGKKLAVQMEDDKTILFVDIPPLSTLTIARGDPAAATPVLENGPFVLENELIRYLFDSHGTIKSAFDKEAGREIVDAGESGNLLCLYEDRPVNWDAWDVDIFYENQFLEQAHLSGMSWGSKGPVRQQIKLTFTIGNSSIEQSICLTAHNKRLDFETRVNWNERHKMLRVAFPTTIHSDTAAFEIQFGHVTRATHRNTSWEMAKFEVCAHRYADLSDRGYGVALLNNCKYGHKILNNIIDLNLLRSPTHPDPHADLGTHEFTYSLLPHLGDLIHSNVLSEAAKLNQPPLVFEGKKASGFSFPVKPDNDQVVLDCLKKAEKEEALILRLYESYGKDARINLDFQRKDVAIYAADLMENSLEKLKIRNGWLSLEFRAFEIKTLKIIF